MWFDASETTDMAVNRHIVGRVGKDHLGQFAVHESSNRQWIEGVSADESMWPKLPYISKPAARSAVIVRKPVFLGIAGFFEIKPIDECIDLGNREAGDAEGCQISRVRWSPR
jgi:hypothetical protein